MPTTSSIIVVVSHSFLLIGPRGNSSCSFANVTPPPPVGAAVSAIKPLAVGSRNRVGLITEVRGYTLQGQRPRRLSQGRRQRDPGERTGSRPFDSPPDFDFPGRGRGRATGCTTKGRKTFHALPRSKKRGFRASLRGSS